MEQPETIVGVRDLRKNLESYISQIAQGRSFIVVKRSKPVFIITPIGAGDDTWEEIVDFTKIKKGGVKIEEILSRM